MNGRVRASAVAGMFYPSDPNELQKQIDGFLAAANPPKGTSPKAIIVPHAGTIYSGPIAATAYATLRPEGISRVVLLGPSHHVFFHGLAASSADAWRTPLGDVPIEWTADTPVNDAAHELEHSLEVQLPFLQTVLGEFKLVPLVVGDAEKEEVSDRLAALWGGPETLVVVSSDLSHYERYEQACAKDKIISQAIVDLDMRGLEPDSACGLIPIKGLIHLAQQKGLRAEMLDLRNSGDTAGSRDQVVGYGAYAFYE